MQEAKRVRVFVSGKVQGVGFREFTRRNALSLGMTGWVRNLADGRVELIAAGEPDVVERFLELIAAGPPHSSVLGCEVREEVSAEKLEDFRILRGDA